MKQILDVLVYSPCLLPNPELNTLIVTIRRVQLCDSIFDGGLEERSVVHRPGLAAQELGFNFKRLDCDTYVPDIIAVSDCMLGPFSSGAKMSITCFWNYL